MSVIKKVALLDDHPIFMQGINDSLHKKGTIEIVYSTTVARYILNYLEHHIVDLVILDISTQSSNGVSLLKEIKKVSPQIKMLILSSQCDLFTVKKAFSYKADGYVRKHDPFVNLFTAINQIFKGKKYVPDWYVKERTELLLQGNESVPKPLTPQELIILKLVCEGKTTNEISSDLGISIHTVNNHRKSINYKTNCNSMMDLLKYALEKGIL